MWKILLLTAIFACIAKSRTPCERALLRYYQSRPVKGTIDYKSYLKKERCFCGKECGTEIDHEVALSHNSEDFLEELSAHQMAEILRKLSKPGKLGRRALSHNSEDFLEELSAHQLAEILRKLSKPGKLGRRALSHNSEDFLEEIKISTILFEGCSADQLAYIFKKLRRLGWLRSLGINDSEKLSAHQMAETLRKLRSVGVDFLAVCSAM